MQKVVDFLEKYVEWLALGLGVAFMLFMAWTYILNDRVSAPLPGSTTIVTPGTVDQAISDGPAKRLHDLMNTPTYVKFDTTDFTASLQDTVNLKNLTVNPTAFAWDWEPLNLNSTGPANPGGGPAQGPGVVVTALPQLPPATPLLVASGQSTILDANNAHKDINWAEVLFTIPAAELQKQWKASFGPENNKPNGPWKLAGTDANTMFLSATLYRSSKLPNGQWSEETEVPRLPTNQLAAYPPATDEKAEDAYALDIGTKQADLVAPKFPDLAPAPFGTNFLTSDKLITQAMTNKSPVGPSGAAAPVQPIGALPAPQPGQPAASPDPVISPNMIAVTVAPTSNASPFNPGDATPTSPDYLITLYDIALKPGATYRYRISYKLKNPLFHLAADRGKDPAFVKDFDLLPTAQGDYSAEVKIESKTHFYVASPVAKGGVKFDVYTQSGGQNQRESFTVNPGDPIGGVKDGVDFATGYTMVNSDITNTQLFVTYMDDDGSITIKEAGKDMDMERKDHPPAPVTPAAGTPPATPTPAPTTPPPAAPTSADRTGDSRDQ